MVVIWIGLNQAPLYPEHLLGPQDLTSTLQVKVAVLFLLKANRKRFLPTRLQI